MKLRPLALFLVLNCVHRKATGLMAPKKKMRAVELKRMVGRGSNAILKRQLQYLKERDVLKASDVGSITQEVEQATNSLGHLFAHLEIATSAAARAADKTLGATATWSLLEPNRLLAFVLDQCPQLAEAYGKAANEHLPTREDPWSLITCFDEFVPGDKLKGHNARKSMVLGYNFIELGEEVLSKDHSWMIPVVLRTQMMNNFQGGWSRWLRDYFRTQLLGPTGLSEEGVLVMIGGAPLVIFAQVTDILPDYDGVRIGWYWKGANAIRCCLRCYCFKLGSGMKDRVGGVEINCTNPEEIIWRDNEDFLGDVDVVTEAGDGLQNGGTDRRLFDLLTKVSGQNYNPDGWVNCARLRQVIAPLDSLTQDWVHGLLSGVLPVDMWCFLERAKDPRNERVTTMADFRQFLDSDDLIFPHHLEQKGQYLWRVFDEVHRYNRDSTGIKADASELLGLYAIMRHFIELRYGSSRELAAERASFEACCDVIDLIMHMKHGDVDLSKDDAWDLLDNKCFNHLEKHVVAYGKGALIPKHHLNHCLGRQGKMKKTKRNFWLYLATI